MANHLIVAAKQNLPKAITKTVDGINYLVCPVVLIKQGILNGELVPLEEIQSHSEAWNGAPFVLGHPERNGINISANDPVILAAQQLGRVFNTYVEGDALKGEVWINPLRAGNIMRGKEVIDRLTNGKPLEVSTAYFRDKDETPGTYNNMAYASIARYLRPDHLAALLDTEGACSWADGCGVPRVNQEDDMPYPNEHALRLQDPGKYIRIRRENDKFGSGIHAIWGVPEGDGGVELQAIRFDKDKFSEAEAKKWAKDHDYTGRFEPASTPAGQEANDASKLSEAFKTVAHALGINKLVVEEDITMEELIKQIVEDGRLGLTAQDLDGLSESFLKKLIKFIGKASKEDVAAKEEADKAKAEADKAVADKAAAEKAAADKKEDKPETNVQTPCPDLDALSKAIKARGGVDVVMALIDGVKANVDGSKASIVRELKANEACAFSEEMLNGMTMDQLVALRKTLRPADYSSQGGGERSTEEQEVALPAMF